MRTILALASIAAFTGAVWAQAVDPTDRPQIVRADHPGQVIFERQCAPCHGSGPGVNGAAMLPGTAALAARYQGARPAELELRDDLTSAALRLFVRRGVGEMPAFRKSELTDSEIDAMAEYIAATADLNSQSAR